MARFTVRGRAGGDPAGGLFGRVLVVLLGLVFLAAGLVAFWSMAQEVVASLAVRGWTETDCTIRDSSVVEGTEHGEDYAFRVAYDWEWEGRRFIGDRVRSGVSSDLELADVYRLAWLYPAGRRVPCRVDPNAPEEAWLEPGSPWEILTLLFPLLFVGVGVLVIGLAVHRGKPAERQAVTRSAAGKDHSTGLILAVFGIFAVAGLGFLLPFFILPAVDYVGSRDWMEVPATVLGSRVESHSGDDGTTYSVDVLYRYEVDGVEMRSDRYDFLGGSSGGYDGKAEIVDRHPPGSEVVAFVDPEEPWSAVLSRDFRGEWLIALLPLLFVVVGVGGMAFTLAGARLLKRKEAAGIESWMPGAPGDERMEAGALVLDTKVSPLGKFLGIVAIAAVWNGIVGVFVWQLWKSYQAGSPDGCLTLFLIPFVLVGLLLLVTVPYQFLAMFNPRPVLTLDRRRLEPGTETTVQWSFRGRGERIRHLQITLEGREEATYRRGTTTYTDKETFFRQTVADTEIGVARGSGLLVLPKDTMHSFAAPNNKIVWTLKLHGAIDRWPDVSEELPLAVEPRRIGS